MMPTEAAAEAGVTLADRVEMAGGPDRALLREVALAVGWHRYSPSEIRKSNPGWIAPEDFCGETVGKDGRRTPKLDSLHSTTVWREPRDYLTSLDAAMSLTAGLNKIGAGPGLIREAIDGLGQRFNLHISFWPETEDYTSWLARYVTAAAIRARAILGDAS